LVVVTARVLLVMTDETVIGAAVAAERLPVLVALPLADAHRWAYRSFRQGVGTGSRSNRQEAEDSGYLGTL
jgi:hypothetical protein